MLPLLLVLSIAGTYTRGTQGIEDTVSSHQNKLQQLTGEGERLCSLRNVGSDLIRTRSAELKALWVHLIEAVALRKKHLLEAQAYYQFFSGAYLLRRCCDVLRAI